MVNSKQKGSKFERDLSKLLSDWSGEKVHRTPQSGAGGSTGWGDDSRMNGDLVFPVESKNAFVYEAKKREGWTLEHLFLDIGEPRQWWKQVVEDSIRTRKHGYAPCLIFSRNRAKTFVLLPYNELVYGNLNNSRHPVSRQTVTFENIRDEKQYYDTLLTTLEGFMSFDKNEIWDIYRNSDWNKLNLIPEEGDNAT